MQYITYHLHSDDSLLDSATSYIDYINKAVELGQPAIAFTEHGNIYHWVRKKIACDKAGIKYIHGVEAYLTETLNQQIADNYHVVLLAKNERGVKEINTLVSISNRPDHFYYKPRISFDEFLNISDNVITTSACLGGVLSNLPEDNPYYEKLCRKFTYYEIQPHNVDEQAQYNQKLLFLSEQYHKPLIAATDTHSINQYKAECRSILQLSKWGRYPEDDKYDLTYKSGDELIAMFKRQSALPIQKYEEAMHNTLVMSESVESFELDTSFKYPDIAGDNKCIDVDTLYAETVNRLFIEKLKSGIIPPEQKKAFIDQLREEARVFGKINMKAFMLSMSLFMRWCRENAIPVGFGRGSVAGSSTAYVLDITDVNPQRWGTIFSRFANESRLEIGDIDVDLAPNDRDKLYNYIIDRFGTEKTAYILAIGTICDRGAIDEIARALAKIDQEKNPSETSRWTLIKDQIKDEYDLDKETTRKKYPELFYYFDGLVNTQVSRSMHTAGIVVSPITLPDNYGTLESEGKTILQID
jgi:DNA polymerase-3 subunit alpha